MSGEPIAPPTIRQRLRARWWPEHDRALSELLEGVPGAGRSALQIAWLCSLLLGAGLGDGALRALGFAGRQVALWWPLGLGLALTLGALWLLRPLGELSARLGALRAVGVCVLLPLLVFAGLGVSRLGDDGPRIGIQLEDVPGGARIVSVSDEGPAHRRLRAGDVVRSVNDAPLPAQGASDELVRRTGDAEAMPPGVNRVELERAGERLVIELQLGPVAQPRNLGYALLLAAPRGLALILLVGLLWWSDRQAWPRLTRGGSWHEIRAGVAGLVLLMFANFAVAMVIGVVLTAAGSDTLTDAEIKGRGALFSALAPLYPVMLVLVLPVAGFMEELVFRGFLLPRLRRLTGAWWSAVLVGAAIFGVGHLYEGTMAAFQTAAIGASLSLVYLARRHLLAPTIAHVGFNALALTMALLFLWLNLFDRARERLEQLREERQQQGETSHLVRHPHTSGASNTLARRCWTDTTAG